MIPIDSSMLASIHTYTCSRGDLYRKLWLEMQARRWGFSLSLLKAWGEGAGDDSSDDDGDDGDEGSAAADSEGAMLARSIRLQYRSERLELLLFEPI